MEKVSTVITSCDCQFSQGYLYVNIYDSEKVCEGTTLLTDGHDLDNPRIIKVDMQGGSFGSLD